MGFYTVDVEVPKNTPKTSPVKVEFEVEEDYITDIDGLIPPGHFCLAGIALFYGIKQLWPKESGTWLKGDAMAFHSHPMLKMPERPTKLTWKAYNEDDTYDHTFYLYVTAEDLELAKPFKVLVDFIAILKKLIGL